MRTAVILLSILVVVLGSSCARIYSGDLKYGRASVEARRDASKLVDVGRQWREAALNMGYKIIPLRGSGIYYYKPPAVASPFALVKNNWTNDEILGERRAVIVLFEFPTGEVVAFETYQRGTL